MNKIFGRIIVAFFAISVIGAVQAKGGPASKAAAAYKNINLVSTLAVEEDIYVPVGEFAGECDDIAIGAGDCVLDPEAMSESKYRILRTTIKAPGNSSLAMDVSLECGNFASLKIKSGRAKLGKMKNSASVRVAVVVTDDKGNKSFAEPYHKEGNPGVVFCQNSTGLQATFAGLFEVGEEVELIQVQQDNNGDGDLNTFIPVGTCDLGQEADPNAEPPQEAVAADVCSAPITTVGTCLLQGENGSVIADTDCFEPEEINLMSSRMSANSFNYFYTPTSNGAKLFQIDVIAWLQNDIKRGKKAKGEVRASIGLGSMFVESIRLVKGKTGEDDSDVEECSFGNTEACTELDDD